MSDHFGILCTKGLKQYHQYRVEKENSQVSSWKVDSGETVLKLSEN